MNAARRSLVDVSQLPEKGEVVIDAEDHVAGRLATYIAKALLRAAGVTDRRCKRGEAGDNRRREDGC